MSVILIVLVALAASALTLISGFGLGTLLLPVFALFFPVDVAIGMTAIVHVLNNIFKMSLLWRDVNRKVLLRFGVPGILGAFVGARVMLLLGDLTPVNMGGLAIQPLSAAVGLLMIFFALTELFPNLLRINLKDGFLIVGGLLSGFFGGLSGHQGALRSTFLIKLGLTKEAYIATGVGIALLVDFTRIPVYISRYAGATLQNEWPTVLAATLAAFVGALIGKRLIPKITLRSVHILVAILMILMGLALVFGWL
jgi:uncharacterized membrane protein YfcA